MLNCIQLVEYLQALHPGAETPVLVALTMSLAPELGDLVAKAPRVRPRSCGSFAEHGPLAAELLP